MKMTRRSFLSASALTLLSCQLAPAARADCLLSGLFHGADTALPPCMPLPRAMLRLPISSTAKVMYARMLDIVFLSGIEDANGILFIHFPIVELAAALARSTMTVKRSLNELEDAGLILRVRQGFGEPNKIYVLIPKKEDRRL